MYTNIDKSLTFSKKSERCHTKRDLTLGLFTKINTVRKINIPLTHLAPDRLPPATALIRVSSRRLFIFANVHLGQSG